MTSRVHQTHDESLAPLSPSSNNAQKCFVNTQPGAALNQPSYASALLPITLQACSGDVGRKAAGLCAWCGRHTSKNTSPLFPATHSLCSLVPSHSQSPTLSHTHFRLLASFPSLSARLSARLRGAETPPHPCPCMCSS
jgi:hypothetical protein